MNELSRCNCNVPHWGVKSGSYLYAPGVALPVDSLEGSLVFLFGGLADNRED